MTKILTCLQTETDGIEAGELFERVWNLTWNPERHQNILDVTLHRFNKLSSSLKAIRSEGAVRLNCAGLIL